MTKRPPLIYKFCKREHAHALVYSGSLRIGTLGDFRNQDDHAAGIGDCTEGKRELVEVINCDEATRENQSWLSRQMIAVPPGAKGFSIVNCEVSLAEDTEDCFIFCAALSRKRSCCTTPEYDSVVEIRDYEKFGLAVAKAVGFKRMILGKVQYGDRRQATGDEPNYSPAFLKSQEYAYQEEFRLGWEAPAHLPLRAFNILVPEVRRFCRLTTIL